SERCDEGRVCRFPIERLCDGFIGIETALLGECDAPEGFHHELVLLRENEMVGPSDDDIHHVINSHETFHELSEPVSIFADHSTVPELVVVDDAGEQDRTQLFQVLSHRDTPGLNEIPAKRRAAQNEDQAEEEDKFGAKTCELTKTCRRSGVDSVF